MRDVVRHETHPVPVQPGQRLGEESRSMLGVGDPKVVPRLVKSHLLSRFCQRRVERVRDRVEIVGAEPGSVEAPAHRLLGKPPGRERHRTLAVLAPAETLLLRCGDDRTVDDQCRRRIMEDRVHAEHTHGRRRTREKRFYTSLLAATPAARPRDRSGPGPQIHRLPAPGSIRQRM